MVPYNHTLLLRKTVANSQKIQNLILYKGYAKNIKWCKMIKENSIQAI